MRGGRGGRASGSIFFQAGDGIRDIGVTGVQTCALPISLPRVDAPYAYAVLLDAGDAEVRGLRAQGQNEVLVGELSSGCRHDPSLRVHGIEVGPPEAGAESDQGSPQRLRYVVRLHVAAYDAGQHRPVGEVVLPVDDHHPDVVAVPG